jgi:methyl-accepting chemotaxis protein
MNSSLLRLIQGAFIVIFLYLLLFGMLTLGFTFSVDQSATQSSRSYDTHRRLTRLRNVVLLTESAERGFLLTGRRSYLISVSDQNAEAERLMDELDQVLADSSERVLMGELRPRITRKLQEMQEMINLQNAGNANGAKEVVLSEEGKQLMEEIHDRIDRMQANEIAIVDKYRARTRTLIFCLYILVGLGLVGFGAFTFVTYRRIESRFTPLFTLVDRAGQISRGDLSGEGLPVGVLDEIGVVTEAFNSMLLGLKRIFTRTEGAQGRIREISSRLARSSAEQASSSVQQATAVQETAVTLEELSQSATQIAERASEVGGESRATASESRRGLEAVQESIRLSEKSRQGVEDVAATIVALSQKAQDLEAIVTSVNELAERSNILSINASIQAAAAGAEGVTFAVLANEMRLLASRSKEATVEVKASLTEIRNGIHKTVMLAEEAVKRSQSGDKNNRRTEETIRSMVESFKKGDDAFQQIVAATRQQSHAFKQVEEALVSIQETAAQAEKGSRELERDSQELTALSEELTRMLRRYDGSTAPADGEPE